MKASPALDQFLKSFERFRPSPYKDSNGYWTIGYGHCMGTAISIHAMTEVEAVNQLSKDVGVAENCVNTQVKVPLLQREFDALVSFVYNCGAEHFEKSTLLKKLNLGNKAGASNELLRWVNPGSASEAGLTDRRQKERRIFLLGDYTR